MKIYLRLKLLNENNDNKNQNYPYLIQELESKTNNNF